MGKKWRWMLCLVLGCSWGSASLARAAEELDMEAAKKSITEGVREQLEVSVQSVSCPAHREIRAGDTFDCFARVEDVGRLTVTVTQKDDEGNIDWTVTKTDGLLDLTKLAAMIQEVLHAKGGVEIKVDCGGRYRGTRVGETFECHAEDKDGEKPTIRVTVKDAEGNVDWKVVGNP